MTDWKPIETAPKDGAAVLGYIPTYEEPRQTIQWDDFVGVWVTNYKSSMEWYADTPTHWMPLPEPPTHGPQKLPTKD